MSAFIRPQLPVGHVINKDCSELIFKVWEERFHFRFCLVIDDDENEEAEDNKARQVSNGTNKDDQTDEMSGSNSAVDEDSMKDEEDEPMTSGFSPLSSESKSQKSPLSDVPSPRHSPSQSESVWTDNQKSSSNCNRAGLEEPVDSSNHVSVVLVSTGKATPGADNRVPLPLSPMVIVEKCDTQTSKGTSPPPSPRTTRSQKRKREEVQSGSPQKSKHMIIHDRYSQALLA